MVDRTVLYNDRTVLFEDEENHDWNLKIFHDRTVLSRTEVSFTSQKCPFFFRKDRTVLFTYIFGQKCPFPFFFNKREAGKS